MKLKIKETYLLFLIVIGLVSLALYSTYALFTASTELTDVVDFTATLSTNNSIAEYEMVTVPAGETKIIELKVTNSYQGTLNYLAWYEMVNPSTINDNISLGLYTEQNSASGSGSIATDETITLLVGIANNTDSEIIVNVGVAGSADENMNLSGNKTALQPGWTPLLIVPAYRTIQKLNLTSSLQNDTPSFGTTSCSDGSCGENTVGIYQAEDDLGISYYFRGDVENNYVKFGKLGKNDNGPDMYWRIIRINGDGSIRMIYDGTTARENGTTLSNETLVSQAYEPNYNDNAYVGYMYGMTGFTEEISVPMCLKLDENSNVVDTYATNSTKEACELSEGEWVTTAYEATHANVKNSAIKDYLENTWYVNNLLDTEYEEDIVDAIYCNDRGLADYNNNGALSNKGYGTNLTMYAFNGDRLDRSNNNIFVPTLICKQENDRFTLEPRIGDVIGNNKLLYPVGLITIDETIFAGMYTTTNTKFYLYTGLSMWSMTPMNFNTYSSVKYSMIGTINTLGKFVQNATYTNSGIYPRPVISIRADAIKSGTGDRLSPFSVEESTSQ